MVAESNTFFDENHHVETQCADKPTSNWTYTNDDSTINRVFGESTTEFNDNSVTTDRSSSASTTGVGVSVVAQDVVQSAGKKTLQFWYVRGVTSGATNFRRRLRPQSAIERRWTIVRPSQQHDDRQRQTSDSRASVG